MHRFKVAPRVFTVEPEDAGLFDSVVHTALGDTRAS